MKHILCGICNSDLSKPFSCGLFSYTNIDRQNYFESIYVRGHMNNEIFSELNGFEFDEEIEAYRDVDACEICLSCGRTVLESRYIYCCRIPFNEIPLIISGVRGFKFTILKHRLEHGIISFASISSGRLTNIKYLEIIRFLIDIHHNKDFLKLIEYHCRNTYKG